MLMVPKGIWAQAGYNTMFGFSGGLGLNITKQIAIEYNYENAFDNQAFFGPSHEITLAYKISTYKNYDYSREDDVASLFSATKRRKPVAKKTNNNEPAISKEERAAEIAQSKQEAEAKTKADAEIKAEAQRLEKERIAQAEAEGLAKLEAEKVVKEEAEAKAKAEAEEQLKEEARAKSELIQKARQEAAAREKAEAEAKKTAEEQAKRDLEIAHNEEKARIEALEKEQAEAKMRAEEQAIKAAAAKAQAEAEVQAQQQAKAKAEAEEAARIAQEEQAKATEDNNNIEKDELSASVEIIEQLSEDSNILLERFQAAINIKDRDLKDLKEENDLNEQGIITQPKPFKSVTEENQAIEAIKSDLDKVIKAREQRIKELEDLYDENVRFATIVNDTVMLYYKKTIQKLKAEQLKTIQTKANLQASLDSIITATEIERKRRIKRAAFNNEKDRYEQDKATLERIKQNTPLQTTPYQESDFDYGEERNGNIQIIKNVQNVNPGYYIILAVHTDVAKRDDFLTKAVASGQRDINFFYDVNTSKYYIYHQKYNSIEEANEAVKSSEGKAYNANLSIIKVEN
jgi:hypothetical protein